MALPLMLDAVLKLSAASRGEHAADADTFSVHSASDIQALSLQSLVPGQVPDFQIIQYLARLIFMKTRVFADSVPETWEHMFASGGGEAAPAFPSHEFQDQGHQSVWFSLIVLMVRLGTALISVPPFCLSTVADDHPSKKLPAPSSTR
jgi:hypothetical protein